MVVARQEERKRAAAVAERDAQARALLRGAAADHRRDRQARVGRVADRIEERLRGEALHHRRSERVHEDRDPEPLGLLEESLELGHAERLAVHIRAELNAREAEALDM